MAQVKRLFWSLGLIFLMWGGVVVAEPRLPQDRAQREEILSLIRDPSHLDAFLQNSRSNSDTKAYFQAVFSNPAEMRLAFIAQPEIPLPFREYLLAKIDRWFMTQRFPEAQLPPDTTVRVAYAHAVLRAFRNSEEQLRRKAFRVYRNAVLPNLEKEDADALKRVLYQAQNRPEYRVVAIPAIFLTESANDLVDRRRFETKANRFDTLFQIGQEGLATNNAVDIDTVVATLEALLSTGQEKRYRAEVQEDVVRFLELNNPRIQEAAFKLLTFRHTGATADTNLLAVGALNKITALLDFERELPNTTRVRAANILARELKVQFFHSRGMESVRPQLDALIGATAGTRDRAVRIAAGEALAEVQPSDEESLLALVKLLGSRDFSLQQGGFRGLGGNDQHRFSQRLSRYASALIRLIDQVEATILMGVDWANPTALNRVDRHLYLLETNPPRDPRVLTRLVGLYGRLEAAPEQLRARVRATFVNAKTFDQESTPNGAVAEALVEAVTDNELEGNADVLAAVHRVLRAHPVLPDQLLGWLEMGNAPVREVVLSYLMGDTVTKKELQNLVNTPEFDHLPTALQAEGSPVLGDLIRIVQRSGVRLGEKHPETIALLPKVLAYEDENLEAARFSAASILSEMRTNRTAAKFLPLDQRGFMEPLYEVAQREGAAAHLVIARRLVEEHTRKHGLAESCIRDLFEAGQQAQEQRQQQEQPVEN